MAPDLTQPIMFAHRGARIDYPENTIPAFEAAIAAGVTGLESDAWVCLDGAVVLAHDRWVGRRPRRRNVRESTAEELAAYGVPTLDAAFDALGTNFEFSIDAKHHKVIEPMIQVARKYGAEQRLWVCYPIVEDLAAIRADTTARLVHSFPKERLGVGLEQHARNLQVAGVDVMNFRHTEWTAGLVALFHRFDIKAFAWDVQEIRHLREMTRIGIDGLYCDRPQRMVETVTQVATGF